MKITVSKDEISYLLQEAINGSLQMKELEERWANFSDESQQLTILYDDLCEAVQHTPGFLLSGKIDLEKWHGMREHAILVCDLLLMPYLDDHSKWSRVRGKVIEGLGDYSYKSVEKMVAEVLSSDVRS